MILLETCFKVSLSRELERFPQLKTANIAEIQQWICTQPHLPCIPDLLIAHFLHSSYYDIEVTKKTVKLNCEYKRSFTEFFGDWDPLEKDLRDIFTNVCRMGFLPKDDISRSRILVVRIRDDSAELFDYALYTKWFFMSFVCQHVHEGIAEEFKVVFDCTHYTFSHFRKSPLALVKKYQKYTNDATISRVTEVHFINTNSAVRKMFSMTSFLMSKKTQNLLHMHAEPEGFFKSCSAEVVPKDYGGSGPTLQTIHDENTNRILSSRKELIEYCNLKAMNPGTS